MFQKMSRRSFARLVGVSAAAISLIDTFRAFGGDEPSATWAPLGALAAKKNIFFGFALNYNLLSTNADYDALVARECTIVTPENAMKWEAVHPARDQYSFTQADAIVAFAETHSSKVRGHTFCWHRALPAWVMRDVTKDNAEAVLRQHIATVAGRYKGKLHSWDVVNEAIQLKDGLLNGWRNSFWYGLLGPAYIEIAFDAAKQADPSAILTYNDFGLEYENKSDNAKRKAVLAMLRDFKRRGVPISALGIQSHLRAGTGESFGHDLRSFIAEARDLGLEIFVTELDVNDSHLNVQGEARDIAIADVYKRYLDLVLGTASVSAVITWGAWDIAKVTGAEAASGPNAERPLLFAPGGSPTLSALAVAQSLRYAPTRTKQDVKRKQGYGIGP
jgi:endo-1,4-beta-xylanase